MAPGATRERGLTALRRFSVGTLLGVTARALRRGESVARHPAVAICREPRLVVRRARPVPLVADGDYQGETTELSWPRHPNAWSSSTRSAAGATRI